MTFPGLSVTSQRGFAGYLMYLEIGCFGVKCLMNIERKEWTVSVSHMEKDISAKVLCSYVCLAADDLFIHFF